MMTNQQKFTPFNQKNYAYVYILYKESEITILEERVLLDFPTLLSTVGGTVGIFLGWSLLDLTRWLSKGLDRLKKRQKTGPNTKNVPINRGS